VAYKSGARSGNGGKSKKVKPHTDPRFRTDIEDDFELPSPPVRAATEPLKGQTKRQCQYMNAIENFDLVFATGPAGTGKTYICASMAADALKSNKVKKVIVTRPAVEAGESLGFLPGELEDKFDPYLTPFREVLEERLGKSHVENLIKMGRIEAAPLAYMRGRTFKDAFVILDEAQNTSPTQMKMFLTRIGRNAKVVVNGDMAQTDVRGVSGLYDAIRRVSFIPSVKHIAFTREDIVRSGLVGEIIQAYDLGEDELKEVTPA
jgi:phosphate starvation-inducible PhoH-like protein